MNEIEGLIKYIRSLPRAARFTAVYLLANEFDSNDIELARRAANNEFDEVESPLWLDILANAKLEKMQSAIDEATVALISQVASLEVQP